MLLFSVLAGASSVLLSTAQPACAAEPLIVPVSKTPSVPDVPDTNGRLPAGPKSRDPAVLMPDCKEAPRTKRKRRLSDYPMA